MTRLCSIANLDSPKEKHRMRNRLALIVTAGVVALVVVLLPIASASAAPSPWWQVLTGTRPSNLWEPTDNVQEIESKMASGPGYESGLLIARIEVDSEVVGCLGRGSGFGASADQLCQAFGIAPEATETAADLEELFEGVFGTESVEATGGPAGTEPLVVTTPRRGELRIFVEPVVGTASSRILSGGGSGRLVLTVTNIGDAPVDATAAPVTIVDDLPDDVEATAVEPFAGTSGHLGTVDCEVEAADRVSCTFEGVVDPYDAIQVEVLASLTDEPPVPLAPGKVTVSGGDAPPVSESQNFHVSPEEVPFGIEHFSARAEEEGGGAAVQAGGHPFQFTTTLQLKSRAGRLVAGSGTGGRAFVVDPPAMPRNLRFPLPVGFVGNTQAVPQCELSDFYAPTESLTNKCPDATAVGAVSVTVIEKNFFGYVRLAVPLFNLEPAVGEPARFGFTAAGVNVPIETEVRPDQGYRVVASVGNTPQLATFLESTVVFWGTPGDPRHDSSRGWNCVYNQQQLGPCEPSPGLAEGPLLRQPVSCASPLDFGLEVEPWNVPVGSVVDTASFSGDPLLKCNQVPFDPTISAAPTSKLAETPTGLDFRLDMPNSGLTNREGVAEGQAKKVEVTLPEGMTINPSQAEGLAVCSPAEYAREQFDSAPGAGCPDAAKIGEVQVTTPLLKEEARGALYIAKPYDNPFGSLIGLYLVARIPERGVLIKQAGKVTPDPETGQLVTTFDNLPQLPFSTFKLHFREGGRAPLVTPPGCGTFETVARFTPWSVTDPDNPTPDEIVTRTSTATIERGVDGGACPSGGAPFRPGFEAGSINPAAGQFSPFYMRITRKDGDQDLTKFSSVLPEGALAKLKGVAQCPQAAVEAAKGKQGLDEKASPSCPDSSRIGRTSVGAGVGSILTYVPGQLYLGGPYHGSTLSVVSVTPAVAGPFDLGTVVVQEGLKLDPATGEVHVDGDASDPIPHILQGIPLKVRDLRVYVDRDKFTITPTSCDPMATKAELFGSGVDVFSVADDVPAELSARYQAADCASLGFKPRVQIRLKAKRSTRGAFPALRAVLRPRTGDANPDRISVALPGSELLEQGHIRTICTRVQFAAGGGFGGGCPERSIYGHVKAWTPLLDEPLEGPVYLRSSDHELPDMVLALHGLVDIESVGRIDSINARIRATFENVPDAPLTKVVLSMQGGSKGLLANSTDICRGVHRAKGVLTGQNGKIHRTSPKVTANCKGKARHRGSKRAGSK
jgi:hypothetical protein